MGEKKNLKMQTKPSFLQVLNSHTDKTHLQNLEGGSSFCGLLRIGCEGTGPIGQHPLPVRAVKHGKSCKVGNGISSGICKKQKQNQRQVLFQ